MSLIAAQSLRQTSRVATAMHARLVAAPGGEDPAPGDEAPPGSPATGEDVCPDCGGSGKRDGTTCATCEGRGKVVSGIGGA